MPDIEKVIKDLEECLSASCRGFRPRLSCPYNDEEWNIMRDALTLLKEQEAVEPYMDFDGHDVWRCGKCGATIFHIYQNASDEDAKNYAKFCRHCGRAVKWNE